MDISRFRHAKQGSQTKDWLDWWLSDEPPSPAAKQDIRQKRVEQANTYQRRNFTPALAAGPAAAANPSVKTIEINLRLPKLKGLHGLGAESAKLASGIRQSRRRSAVWSAAALLAILALIAVVFRGPSPADQTQSAAQKAASSNAITSLPASAQAPALPTPNNQASLAAKTTVKQASSTNKPSFTPVVPKSQPQLANSTFGRTAYDPGRDVYTIMDTYLGSPLTINETAIPSNQNAQQALNQSASQIGAAQGLSVSGVTAFVQPNTSSGSQTAVFALHGVLVYVNSPKVHSLDQWKTYLESLQ
jgi:hypothetical protein